MTVRYAPLILLFVFVVAAPVAVADIFLKVEGVSGSVERNGEPGWIRVVSYNDSTPGRLRLQKSTDRSSVELIRLAHEGTATSAVLETVSQDGTSIRQTYDGVTILKMDTITLEDTSWPHEEMTLQYQGTRTAQDTSVPQEKQSAKTGSEKPKKRSIFSWLNDFFTNLFQKKDMPIPEEKKFDAMDSKVIDGGRDENEPQTAPPAGKENKQLSDDTAPKNEQKDDKREQPQEAVDEQEIKQETDVLIQTFELKQVDEFFSQYDNAEGFDEKPLEAKLAEVAFSMDDESAFTQESWPGKIVIKASIESQQGLRRIEYVLIRYEDRHYLNPLTNEWVEKQTVVQAIPKVDQKPSELEYSLQLKQLLPGDYDLVALGVDNAGYDSGKYYLRFTIE